MGDMMMRWFSSISQAGDHKMNYITGSGAYIDTGSPVLQGDKITIKFLTGSTNGEQYIYGWRYSGTYSNPYQLLIAINGGNRAIAAGKANSAAATGNTSCFSFDTINTIVIDSSANTITVNGSTPSGLQYDLSNGAAFNSSGSSERNPFILAFNRIGTATGPCDTTRLYEYKVERSGNVVTHFIPYFKANGFFGMYDEINDVFYRSANTKKFSGG